MHYVDTTYFLPKISSGHNIMGRGFVPSYQRYAHPQLPFWGSMRSDQFTKCKSFASIRSQDKINYKATQGERQLELHLKLFFHKIYLKVHK